MRKNLSKIIIISVFLVGLSVMLYPTLSNRWNMRVQTAAITQYKAAADNTDTDETNKALALAEQYNRALAALSEPLKVHDSLDNYNELLNMGGTGIMGYISIARLNTELPIYHGTDEAVLNVAVGHLEGSSLPVGGKGTHAVLSAHRGLPSAKLFSDLDKMQTGDLFTVTVLSRTLTYQVDSIVTVLPSETAALAIDKNEDYCTLMTCTPYGINSHRLLVRGKRVSTAAQPAGKITGNAQAVPLQTAAVLYATPMVLVWFTALLIKYRKSEKRRA